MNLQQIETDLIEKGYKKYHQSHRGSTVQYWKTFFGYQVGVLIYDFSKYKDSAPSSILYECMFIGINDRIDLTVKKDIDIEAFEEMSKHFYKSIEKYK